MDEWVEGWMDERLDGQTDIDPGDVLCSTSFSEWIILRTGGQTWYNYFIPPSSV